MRDKALEMVHKWIKDEKEKEAVLSYIKRLEEEVEELGDLLDQYE